jgi:hypothetical protein
LHEWLFTKTHTFCLRQAWMNNLQSCSYMCLHKTLQLDGSTVLQYCVCGFLEKSVQNPWIYIFNYTSKKARLLMIFLKNIHTHSLHAALVKCLGSSTKVSRIIFIYCKSLVSLLKLIVTGLSDWSLGFNSRSGHVTCISVFLCQSHSTNAPYLLIINTTFLFTIQCN